MVHLEAVEFVATDGDGECGDGLVGIGQSDKTLALKETAGAVELAHLEGIGVADFL